MWSVVMPVKGTSNSKSRFGSTDNRELAIGMALDTVTAALAAGGVDEVIVVTALAKADVDRFAHLGAIVIADPGEGLSAAIEAGLAAVAARHAGDSASAVPANGDPALARNRAVLLGDLPGLRAAQLGAALAGAAGHPLAIVADSDGTGTTLATATAGHRHSLAFGPDSRAAHLAAGYAELAGVWPGLRRDVDLPEHLDGMVEVGAFTAAAWAKLGS